MLAVSGVMEGGGVAGLAQMRALLSGERQSGGAGYVALETIEEGGSSRGGPLKRAGGAGASGSGGVLDSARYLESQSS